MAAGHVILSANDSTRQAVLGSQHINVDLEELFGPRAYVYVRNHDAAAWTKGLAVRQRQDLFNTEGTSLTGDSNSTTNVIADASGPGAPWTTANYVPDTLEKVRYWHALQVSPTTSALLYEGKVIRNTADIKFYLEAPTTAAITNSGAYTIYLPYAFIKTAANETRLTGGVTQAAISAGHYGWVQIAGWGYVMTEGNATAVADGVGIIGGATAGYGKGTTLGTNDALIYAIPNIDSTGAAGYQPAMIRVPGVPVMGK